MPPKKRGVDPARVLKIIPTKMPIDVGNKLNQVDEMQKEIEELKKENEKIREEIDVHEKESLKTIEEYRNQNDQKTTQINAIKRKIKQLFLEKDQTIQKMIQDNEEKKEAMHQEDIGILKEIDKIQAALNVIHKFEEDRETIASNIADLEKKIEEEKKMYDISIEEFKNQAKMRYIILVLKISIF